MSDKPRPSPAPAYVFLVPLLANAARPLGYAIAVHGSLVRDLDVVAIPWTVDAAPAEELVAKLVATLGWTTPADALVTGPEAKPHGRLAWSIPLDCGPWIDLSVIPRQPNGGAP
jgi:hypothetical protein